MAAIGNFNFHGVAVTFRAGDYTQAAHRRALHSLGGIIDQVRDDLAQKLSIRFHGRKPLGQFGAKNDAIEAIPEKLQRAFDDRIHAGNAKASGREASELRELVYQRFESLNLSFNQPGAFSRQLFEFARAERRFDSIAGATFAPKAGSE